MADSGKNPGQVFDVSRPSRNMPSPTSRNLVVSNSTAPDNSVIPPPPPAPDPPQPVPPPEPDPAPAPIEQSSQHAPVEPTAPADDLAPAQPPQPVSGGPQVIPAVHPPQNVKHLYGWRKFLLWFVIMLAVGAALAFVLDYFEVIDLQDISL